jgi:hypothetical protein
MNKFETNNTNTWKNLKSIKYLLLVITILFSVILYPRIKEHLYPDEQDFSAIQEEKIVDKVSIPTVFYKASNFKIIGKLPNTKNYARLPEEAQSKVSKPIWRLSKNTAGISIRFSSNTSKIIVRWTLNRNSNPTNLSAIAAKGLDLYAYVDDKWQFVGAAKPKGGTQNEAIIINGMETKNREFLLNLPLYNEISDLEIGIDEGKNIWKPKEVIIDTLHPIIFYGTSITQGASASRPGLTYPALIERHFNKETINLGFSGNGTFQKEIGEFMMTANPSIIVLDCTPNSDATTIRNNLPDLLDHITSINNTIPIILVESIVRDFSFFKKDDINVFGTMSFIKEQNKALRDVYESNIKLNRNLFYVTNENLIGNDHEATSDGTHLNDLGHYRVYERIRQEIEKHIK